MKRYALILGASSGFGRASAIELAKEGFGIYGVHLDRSSTMPLVGELINELTELGAEPVFYNVNAADADRRSEIIADIVARNNGQACIGVLLHSLAFGSLQQLVPVNEGDKPVTQKQLEMTLDVMANSLVYWTQDLLKASLFCENSRIFGLTSAGSRRVLPMYGAVSAAKTAMESYCRQLAMELAPLKITANAICAGVTATPALSKIPGNDIIIANAMMRNPNHRLTTPEDVAKFIRLLSKPESSWVNGDVIRVDGGEDAIDLTWWKPNS